MLFRRRTETTNYGRCFRPVGFDTTAEERRLLNQRVCGNKLSGGWQYLSFGAIAYRV